HPIGVDSGGRLSSGTPMPLVKGTLDVLVLKALSWTPMHAFEVARWLDARSAGQLEVEDGALMQALRRLEERSLLTAEWGMTDNGRRARYYRLTRKSEERRVGKEC